MGLKMRAGRACSWSFSAYTMFSGRSDLSEDQRDAIQVCFQGLWMSHEG